MPLTRLKCSKGYIEPRIESCIECENLGIKKCDYTLALLSTMLKDLSLNADPSEIHVTDLTSCIRSAVLKKLYPYTESIDDLLWRVRGKVFHRMLEMEKVPNVLAEYPFQITFKFKKHKFKLVGVCDEYYPDQQLIVDYKSTLQVPSTPYSNHKWQLNFYRYMAKKQLGIDTKLRIVYMDAYQVKQLEVQALPFPEIEQELESRLRSYVLVLDYLKNFDGEEFLILEFPHWYCQYCPKEIRPYCWAIEMLKILKSMKVDVKNKSKFIDVFAKHAINITPADLLFR
ncbi:MAG: PD-(D/E)XK nuclease family protein [Candidatus Aenigmatarchaeota archaeon]